MQKEKTYENIKITAIPQSQIQIEGEITKEEMGRTRALVLKKMTGEVILPGFRKGNVPEHIIISKFGEMHILEDAAEVALRDAYPQIVTENSIAVIGRPEIIITKIAKDSPLGFKITAPVFPEVSLGDYKKTAKKEVIKEEVVEVTDDEVASVLKQLQENKARAEKKIDAVKESGDEVENEKENPLPPIDEQFIKSFGDFKDIEDFKTKIKENLLHEKKTKNREKKRLAIGDSLVSGSSIELPEVLIEGELQKMFLQFEEDLKRMGLTIENYLADIQKSRDDLKKEWRDSASKRVKLQIILNKIALEEKIKASSEEIEKEVQRILESHKDADREKVLSYIDMMLTNEKVFQFLEQV